METSKDKFIRLITDLLSNLISSFPECEKVKKVKTDFEKISSIDMLLDEFVEAWSNHLEEPLPESVTYRAPLTRILSRNDAGGEPLMFHAYLYGDIETIAENSPGNFSEKLELEQKWNDPLLDQESKIAIAMYLNAINETIFIMKDKKIPPAPSRADIQEEIETFQESFENDEQSKLTMIFQIMMSEFVDEIKLDNAISMHDWHKAFCDVPDEMLMSHDFSIFKDKNLAAKMMKANDPNKAWSMANKLVAVTRANASIPKNVQRKIEEIAGNIAVKIQDGTMNLNDINLASLGENVLEQITEDELQHINENMSSLTPLFNDVSMLQHLI